MNRIETGGDHTRLCEHSPQLPQGFTPVSNITFWPGQPSSGVNLSAYDVARHPELRHRRLVCEVHECVFMASIAMLGACPLSSCPGSTGETLEATCDFSSLERDTVTSAGSTHHDEMCNLYMMMWSELPVFLTCSGGGKWNSAPYTNMHGPGKRRSCLIQILVTVSVLTLSKRRLCLGV